MRKCLITAAMTGAVLLTGLALAPPAPAQDEAAYLFVEGYVTDRVNFGAYTSALPPLYQRWGGEYFIVAGPASVELLHGHGGPRSMVVSKWPDIEAIEQFWWSNPYQQDTVPLREKAGTFDVIAVPGRAAAAEQGAVFVVAYGGAPQQEDRLLAFVNQAAEFLPAGAEVLATGTPDGIVPLEGAFNGDEFWLARFPDRAALDAWWNSSGLLAGRSVLPEGYRILAVNGPGPGRPQTTD